MSVCVCVCVRESEHLCWQAREPRNQKTGGKGYNTPPLPPQMSDPRTRAALASLHRDLAAWCARAPPSTPTPKQLGYTMPGEFEPHAACWMGWPSR